MTKALEIAGKLNRGEISYMSASGPVYMGPTLLHREAADALIELDIQLGKSKEVVAWRYRRIGRPNKWIVTTNAELVAGLPAKGGHIIEALSVAQK